MSDLTTGFVEAPAGRIAYRRIGSGPALVLLHPLALAGRIWDPVAGRLATRFDVIAPDARGHGDTAWDGDPFGVPELADDVIALLDGLGLPSAHLAGMSMGGSVAIAVSGRHPDRVDRLALADTTSWYGEDAPTTWDERADLVLARTRAAQVPFQVDRWFTQGFRNTHPARVSEVVGVFLQTSSRAHAQACRALGAMDSRALLPAISAPTLAFAGDEDCATPPAMTAYVAEQVPNGVALTLPGVRHLSMVERPGLSDLVAAHLLGTPLPELTAGTECGCAEHVDVSQEVPS